MCVEHDAVVGGVEGVFVVRVHDVDVFVVELGILHHQGRRVYCVDGGIHLVGR
jgi:hypothetical protein